MDGAEFQRFAAASAQFIAGYLAGIRDRPVLPAVEPGYLRPLLPEQAPARPERWQDVLEDLQRVILPGITHWQSPHFHAFYPTSSSFASVVGEMLIAGIGCLGFSWMASPACTELEAVVLDWLARLLHLPEHFLNAADGPGGGALQGSASEATLVALLAAKERSVRRLKESQPGADEAQLKTKLVAYTSDQANSSVEKAGLLASTVMRLLPADEQGRLRGAALQAAVAADREQGLVPCYVVATLGTTPTCAFDCLPELGAVCRREGLWLHVDAAYAGTAFICQEYRHLMDGAEYADSFNFNPHKWMLVNFDCSAMWVRDSRQLIQAFSVDRIYLAHRKQGMAPDYRHWQIPLGRRFRALKLWLVLRLHGADGLRAHVRRQVALARRLEQLLRADPRFQLVHAALGLVCFRMQGDNERTQALLDALTLRRRIYVIAGCVSGQLVVRFAVCSRFTEPSDIDFAWEEILGQADILFPTQQEAQATENNSLLSPALPAASTLATTVTNGRVLSNGHV